MTEEVFYDDAFKSQLDAEGLLLMHMNRIAMYRDTDPKQYCSSVETFIILCPRYVREKGMLKMKEMNITRCDYSNITHDKKIIYDDLLMYINELLEKQKMIWKKRSVRTFE